MFIMSVLRGCVGNYLIVRIVVLRVVEVAVTATCLIYFFALRNVAGLKSLAGLNAAYQTP
jgi:hypothetical protein